MYSLVNSSLPIINSVLPVIMSTLRPNPAKIIQHAAGLGAPNTETVRKRAQELAIINGRTEFTENDWADAKRELHGGGHELDGSNGGLEMVALMSEHDMIVADTGHHIERVGMEDDENIVEELIAEGM